METIQALSVAIEHYIASRKEDKLLDIEKELEQLSDKQGTPEYLAALEKKQALQDQFSPEQWLTKASGRADKISVATHPIKFFHSDAKGLSGRVAAGNQGDSPYLMTSSLRSLEMDMAAPASVLDVAGLLLLKANGKTLADFIFAGDASPLAKFASSEEQLMGWLRGFFAVFQSKDVKSHGFARQIYFPVADGYHLLSPMLSSSLAQVVFDRVQHSRYSEEAVAARKARREGQYSALPVVEYPKMAVQSFGGSKPQNISKLNSTRGGKVFLIPSLPPIWVHQETPPTKSPHAFWHQYERRVSRTLRDFRRFLLSHQHRTSTMLIRQQRAGFTESLIDQLIMLASDIQNRPEWAGWSYLSSLSEAECLWLDPLYDDAEFQKKRQDGAWQEEIAGQFAAWMNKKLAQFKLDVDAAEYLYFKKELHQRLQKLKGEFL